MTQFLPSIIGTIAPLLDSPYTHSQLNVLFMQFRSRAQTNDEPIRFVPARGLLRSTV
jgi:hypothetical protein